MSLLVSEYHYFSPVTWFSALPPASHCIFFKYDEYRKMSFRNRCVIAGANGPINLSVPILGGRNIRILTNEIMIDNRLPWQNNHWKSICSCYNHAPWFEEYGGGCKKIFETRYERLADLNRAVFEWVLIQIKWPLTWEEGEVNDRTGWISYLNKFVPKKMKDIPATVRYRQVFQERTGFLPHLSILDLLFCAGPLAGELLAGPIKHGGW
jgi:hypothetical protein